MVDAGIGRLLVASLHQGIGDVIPTRLAFYENWLTPPGLRAQKFGLAPLHAVLSFLRLEGKSPYTQVMSKAGTYTGEWAYLELPSVRRWLVSKLPMSFRARGALALSRRLFRQTFRGSSAKVRLQKGSGQIEIHGSIFCSIRETAAWPMCIFYSSALERFLASFDIDAAVDVHQCRAAGGDACTMAITIRGALPRESTAEAA